MKKSLLRRVALATIILVAIPLLSTQALASAPPEADGKGPYVDADGTTHEDAVAAIWAADVTTGCGEWLFCPDEPVTRAEMAAFLTRALPLEPAKDKMFVDTNDNPHRDAIRAIAAAEVTHGCSREHFCPDEPVTREQMASFLARALELEGTTNHPFQDISDSVHEVDIALIASKGLTSGCSPTKFCPERLVTRAEMAAFLARGLDLPVPDKLPSIPEDVIADYRDETGDDSDEPREPGAEGWRDLVEQYFPASEVDRAIRIIDCESNGDPNARNPSSGASGLFQHLPRYWPERSNAAGFAGSSIYDPEANIGVAAWLVYEYPAGGWHHWTCK
ncbi:MAG: transglycosylase SLT domain-containing protein [Acidimicrobiia bacterium]|nr:transglycosylase SLT domain-containing protein [Acidimicrobiia bacterium]